MADIRVHAEVFGGVQGVGYRAYVQLRAGRLGLKGWVRNQPDGSVEVIAEGTADKIDALLEDLRRGPSMSEVDRVEHSLQDASGEFSRFSVRY